MMGFLRWRPWHARDQHSAEADAAVEASLEKAKDATDAAIEAIRGAYTLAEDRLTGDKKDPPEPPRPVPAQL